MNTEARRNRTWQVRWWGRAGGEGSRQREPDVQKTWEGRGVMVTKEMREDRSPLQGIRSLWTVL